MVTLNYKGNRLEVEKIKDFGVRSYLVFKVVGGEIGKQPNFFDVGEKIVVHRESIVIDSITIEREN